MGQIIEAALLILATVVGIHLWTYFAIRSYMKDHNPDFDPGTPIKDAIDRMLTFFMGKKCPSCGKRNRESSHGRWSRGYNHYCKQATSDSGWRCYDCGYIEWDKSLEEFESILPSWCEAHKRENSNDS